MNLLSLLIRIARGERLERATPAQLRWGAVPLLIIPVIFLLLLLIQKHNGPLLDRIYNGSATTLWIKFVVFASALVFASLFWSRHIPLQLTIILAVIAWAALLWLLFGLGY